MSAPLPVRITVTPVWDEVLLELPAETPVGEVKRQALAATRVVDDPARFLVKYRGAHLSDEQQSLREAGVVPNAPLIVLPRRRWPLK